MKDFSYLNEKRMAIILWAKKGNEDDVVVYAGKIFFDENRITVLLKENLNLEISKWVNCIKPVTQDLKETLLNADFCLSLSVGDLPENELLNQYIKTGLKWPE